MKLTSLSVPVVSLIVIVSLPRFVPAAPITWTIQEQFSRATLSIPQQNVSNVGDGGTSGAIQIRNQTGSSTTWNLGNLASLSGTIATNYSEGGSIAFLSGQASISGVNSGNYRPNVARFDPHATDTSNPNGSFTGSTASDFAAVFAFKERAVVIGINLDTAYSNLSNVHFELGSSALPLSGSPFTTQTFNPLNTSSGILSSSQAIDALNALLVGQIFPDAANAPFSVLGSATSGTGTIAWTGANTRQMTLTLTVPLVSNFGLPTSLLSGTLTETIVATATVPEPAPWTLATIGCVGLAVARLRGRRRHGAG